jgi:hypothetical protein
VTRSIKQTGPRISDALNSRFGIPRQ